MSETAIKPSQHLCPICERPRGIHVQPFPCPEPGLVLVATGDTVILRSSKQPDNPGHVALPDSSPEKYHYIVIAISPDVLTKGLQVGDRVLALGQPGVHWDVLPGFPRLVIVRASKDVVVRWKRQGEE